MLKPRTIFAEPEVDENRRSFLFPGLSEVPAGNQLTIPDQENKTIQLVTDEEAMFWDELEGDQKERAARLLEMEIPLERIMKMVRKVVFENSFSRREVLNGAKNAVVNQVLSSLLPMDEIARGILAPKKEVLMPGVEKIRDPELRSAANAILKQHSGTILSQHQFAPLGVLKPVVTNFISPLSPLILVVPEKNTKRYEKETETIDGSRGFLISVPEENKVDFIPISREKFSPDGQLPNRRVPFDGAEKHELQIDFSIQLENGVLELAKIEFFFNERSSFPTFFSTYSLPFELVLFKRNKSDKYVVSTFTDSCLVNRSRKKDLPLQNGDIEIEPKNLSELLNLFVRAYAYLQNTLVLQAIIYGFTENHGFGSSSIFHQRVHQSIFDIFRGREPLASDAPELDGLLFHDLSSFVASLAKLQEISRKKSFG